MKKYIFKGIILEVTSLLIILSVSCTHNIRNEKPVNANDYFTIWALSDIQPRKQSENLYFKTAIEDMNENFPKTELALVAGDIIHYREKAAEIFSWYVETRKKSTIKYWYEINGNHDQKDPKSYREYIKLPNHYSVHIGNILILCLSDETDFHQTEISEDAFEWWKKMVIGNQDKIIITMTHGFVKKSWLMGTIIESRNINITEKFSDVLEKYKVDIWLAGHTHMPHWLKGSLRVADNLNNTIFMNVSAIRGGKYMDVESFLLFFKQGTDDLIIKSRNHDRRKFSDYYETNFKLSHEFQWDGKPPVMKPME